MTVSLQHVYRFTVEADWSVMINVPVYCVYTVCVCLQQFDINFS